MTVTIKDAPDVMGSSKPGSPAQSSDSPSGQSPRSNPVCLEVPITIRSLPGEGGDAPGSAGAIRQEGKSVIVFDNGGVLRVSNPLPPGQKIILSDQQGREVACRVVGGRNIPNMKGYIEVEFIEPADDFWNIHQTPRAPQSATLASLSIPEPAATPLPQPENSAVAPRGPVSVKEQDALSGGAPTFEDVAGLVLMSPQSPARGRKIEPPNSPAAPKSKSEPTQNSIESLKPEALKPQRSSLDVVTETPSTGPIQEPIHNPIHNPIRKEAFSSDFLGKLSQSSVLGASVAASNEPRGRMPLVLGGVALLLVGFGGGYFFLHNGNAPSNASPAAVASQPPTSVPAVLSSGPAVVPVPQSSAEQAPAQTSEPVLAASSSPAGVAVPVPGESQGVRPRPVIGTATKKADTTALHIQAIPNLKMSSPVAPNKNIANLSDGASSTSAEVTPTEAPGSISAGAFRSRTENLPAPPPPLVANPAVSAKASRDAKLISSTQPIYPAMAKTSNVQGSVNVTVNIDEFGKVIAAKAISGPMLLRQAAVDAVKRWKYSPAQVDDKPAPSQSSVTVEFRLK
jgi:TonB family protein